MKSDSLTGCMYQEQVNIAQKAHIYAFSSDGPRGNRGVPKGKLNDLNNLMFVCHECHEKMDQKRTAAVTPWRFSRR